MPAIKELSAPSVQTHLHRLAALVVPVPDAARMLGVSRQYVLQLITTGKLESVKIGRDYCVSSLSLQEMIHARRASGEIPRKRQYTKRS